MSNMSVSFFYNMANDRCTVGIHILLCKSFFCFIRQHGQGQYPIYVIFSISVIFCTATCLLIHIGVVNQRLSQFFWKFGKLSSVLRKFYIARYGFTSVNAMKNQKIGWATGSFPVHSPNQCWAKSCHHDTRSCDCPLTPCICNNQQQLQYILT